MKKRVLSGIQPSGKLHLGNYFGAVKRQIELQSGLECFYFIADFHSLTTVHDAEVLKNNIKELALAYLALGVDPEKTALYRQSDVPEIPEIALLLSMVVGMGELERCHAYKDKTAKGIKPNVGLFYYPILMAADILSMQPDFVPVGADQEQHVQLTRDLAVHFNSAYGNAVLNLPKAVYGSTPKIYGTTLDAEGRPLKMSKSYGNTIDIFASEKELKKTIMGIQTNSQSMEEELNTDSCLIYSLYSLFATKDECQVMKENYRHPSYGYGHAKKELLEKVLDYFAEARDKRAELEARKDSECYVEDILHKGSEKARYYARKTLDIMREACGLDRSLLQRVRRSRRLNSYAADKAMENAQTLIDKYGGKENG